MPRLYVNQTLERQIRQYCEINEIDDINAFANRCLSQGFNIVKFGMSPKDNMERENKGIKDIKNEKKKDISRENRGKQELPKEAKIEVRQEESKPKEEGKQQVTIRKIRIIKKS